MGDDIQIATIEALEARLDAQSEEIRKLRVTSDLHNDFFYALYDGGIDDLRACVDAMHARNKVVVEKSEEETR